MASSKLHAILVAFVSITLVQYGAEGLPANKEEEDDIHKQQLVNQTSMLVELGCKPVLQPVNFASLMETHDELSDKAFYPKVVAIWRCAENCSFCGSTKLGKPKNVCRPDPKERVEKNFTIFTYGKNGKKDYVTRKAIEHMACKCMEKE